MSCRPTLLNKRDPTSEEGPRCFNNSHPGTDLQGDAGSSSSSCLWWLSRRATSPKVKFPATGRHDRARWMARAIYADEERLFAAQLGELAARRRELSQPRRFTFFVAEGLQ
ncbi:hypothetical protein GWK47_048616 [Chionoecetes opilio]|uniref:Uncharacterized protein n=1 Tax=Chionoecetes opilio TaxID=41210 RepID=A0A8J4YAW1_CHIOP|nr:hypothetical protein GWK47_048616 [Chionoecetes opilio]